MGSVLILSDFVGSADVAMAVSRAVLTRMGHRALCLPTALISNIWSQGEPAQLDTTDYLRAALDTWERRGLHPEGVLISYLAGQIADEHPLRVQAPALPGVQRGAQIIGGIQLGRLALAPDIGDQRRGQAQRPVPHAGKHGPGDGHGHIGAAHEIAEDQYTSHAQPFPPDSSGSVTVRKYPSSVWGVSCGRRPATTAPSPQSCPRCG